MFADACCGEPEFDRGFKRLIKEIFPRAGVPAPAAAARAPGLAGQASAFPRDPPALGHRARLPHGADLLAAGPLLLLEPDRTQPDQSGGHQGGPGR